MSEEITNPQQDNTNSGSDEGQKNNQEPTPPENKETSFLDMFSEPNREKLKDFKTADEVFDRWQASVSEVEELKGKVPVIPEEYKFEPPDTFKQAGIEINKEALQQYHTVAKELGLTQEQYQKALEFQIGDFQAQVEKYKKGQVEILKNEWKDKFDANKDIAAKAVRTFVSEEEYQKLDKEGFLNNATLTKIFHKIGTRISEDGLIEGQTTNKPEKTSPFPFKSMD